MWRRLVQILEMIRFSHTVFALPFALMAGLLAWTTPTADGRPVAFRWRDLVGILICMVCARSAAMAFNRIADRRLDAANPRTATRHLPAGKLTLGSVMVFTLLMSAAFVAATLLFLPNRLPLWLSVPVLLFLLAYSYTKRFTMLAHFWLGASLMLAPVSAWIAIRGQTVLAGPLDLLPAMALGSAVLLWVAGFDVIYACQDVEYDKRARLRSVPARFGVPRALHIAAACHVAMVVGLVGVPLASNLGGPPVPLGWIYYASVAAIAGLLAYEHSIVRPDDLTRVNIAFFNINALISVGLLAVVAIDVFV